MDNTNIQPGYLLPRGKYKRRKPGKRPEVAQRLLDQEKAIVERTRIDAEKLKQKEIENEQGTVA